MYLAFFFGMSNYQFKDDFFKELEHVHPVVYRAGVNDTKLACVEYRPDRPRFKETVNQILMIGDLIYYYQSSIMSTCWIAVLGES